ncbi:PEP-CTERM sorting domain-containing protein [Scytonema sp. UIC 10036]|uniref:SGNH/GDSL hydrolase family protein n=1 Tax=Scytonema sp. UIC 10036 TaxID=2304196 RepID=UPI0012DA369D|nr:SGNH/GDSL hydrolase family protein [Scytonema sp. UIC 10036]MUG96337.1 PEP-CTERM sorting domain-containing protein [Scytonema sp. UIC 10036]
MKKEILTAGFVLFSLSLPLKASAAFSQFNVFGDSLSDTGNVFTFTQQGSPTGVIPPSPPYFQGRFSNDKIWVDYFGDAVGLTPTLFANLGSTVPTQGINFAFGGSKSGQDNAFIPGAPGVLAQVSGFLATNQKVDANGLYAVWGGGNDYLFGQNPDVVETVENISNSVGLLAQAGAKNILVFNLPDLGRTPIALRSGNSPILTAATNAHNQALATSVAQLSNNIPGVNIIPVDINSLFNRAIANPEEFGFKDVTTSCVVYNIVTNQVLKTCNNPNDFLFFDEVHPTTNAHKLVAETALAAIRGKSVPEPSTTFGMLTFGALGAAMFKYKRKQLAVTRTKSNL